jgi:hypothetical protein
LEGESDFYETVEPVKLPKARKEAKFMRLTGAKFKSGDIVCTAGVNNLMCEN